MSRALPASDVQFTWTHAVRRAAAANMLVVEIDPHGHRLRRDSNTA